MVSAKNQRTDPSSTSPRNIVQGGESLPKSLATYLPILQRKFLQLKKLYKHSEIQR